MQNSNAQLKFLSSLFLLSGLAALVYQVSWQRLLFAAFGADLESVTIVVSAFMLGLGAGALAGGWCADRFPAKTLVLFALCESGIGVYGMLSPELMRHVGDLTVASSLPVVALVNFLLVLLPALLMGATLPILAAHTARLWQNVGRATGYMYAANTFGAALGALGAGFLLFYCLTLDGAIRLAACINLLVAGLALWRLRSIT